MRFIADAIERAGSPDRAKIKEALATSSWENHFMPYGPTKIVNGQNQGAQPLITQVLDGEIEVVSPAEFMTRPAVFPRPA